MQTDWQKFFNQLNNIKTKIWWNGPIYHFPWVMQKNTSIFIWIYLIVTLTNEYFPTAEGFICNILQDSTFRMTTDVSYLDQIKARELLFGLFN